MWEPFKQKGLAAKVARARYYWPHFLYDVESFVKKCPKCQEHALMLLCPPEELTSIMFPWPFAQWGLDLIGLFQVAKGEVKFVVVAVIYFMKWVKAEALATITAQAITKLLWKLVVYQFGIPQNFISNNGRQFNCSHY